MCRIELVVVRSRRTAAELDARFREQLRRRQLQGARHSLQSIDGNHALAPFYLAHVGEAQLRLKGEFLLGQLPRTALRTNGLTELALKLGSAVWHVG